jgi:hypothetical protein
MSGFVILGNPLGQEIEVGLFAADGTPYILRIPEKASTLPIYEIGNLTPQAWTLVGARHLRVATQLYEALSANDIVSSFWGASNWGQEPKVTSIRLKGSGAVRCVVIGPLRAAAGPSRARGVLQAASTIFSPVNAQTGPSRARGRARVTSYLPIPSLAGPVRGRGRTSATTSSPVFADAGPLRASGRLQAFCSRTLNVGPLRGRARSDAACTTTRLPSAGVLRGSGRLDLVCSVRFFIDARLVHGRPRATVDSFSDHTANAEATGAGKVQADSVSFTAALANAGPGSGRGRMQVSCVHHTLADVGPLRGTGTTQALIYTPIPVQVGPGRGTGKTQAVCVINLTSQVEGTGSGKTQASAYLPNVVSVGPGRGSGKTQAACSSSHVGLSGPGRGAGKGDASGFRPRTSQAGPLRARGRGRVEPDPNLPYWEFDADDLSVGSVTSWDARYHPTLNLGLDTGAPQAQASQINGHKAVLFDGIGDGLTTSGLYSPWTIDPSPFEGSPGETLYLVCREVATTGTNAFILDTDDTGNIQRRAIQHYASDGSFQHSARNATTPFFNGLTGLWKTVITRRVEGQGIQLWINGGDKGTTAFVNDATEADHFTLGKYHGLALLHGYVQIGLLGRYKRAVSDNVIDWLRGYLGTWSGLHHPVSATVRARPRTRALSYVPTPVTGSLQQAGNSDYITQVDGSRISLF